MDRPRLVHRLDRDTSGVLLLGKSPAAAAKLSGAFAKRRAKKVYWAIVAGNPKPPEGVLELPLVKKGVGDRELVVPASAGEFGAETAETEFVTIVRAAHRAAWMALQPHTGRTHQLRAHMKAMGHPILGDPKYCDEGVGFAVGRPEAAAARPPAGTAPPLARPAGPGGAAEPRDDRGLRAVRLRRA